MTELNGTVTASADQEPEPCGTCCGYGAACACGDMECTVSWYDPDHVPEPCTDCDGLNIHLQAADAFTPLPEAEAEAEAEPGGWA
jgi:hypothetical protein